MAKRPTKNDVFNAFYEGVCTVLMSGNVLGEVTLDVLEVDRVEFARFLAGHPEFNVIRDAMDIHALS